MTRAQQRAVALSATRYQSRHLKVNLLEAAAQDAHQAIDGYARRILQWSGRSGISQPLRAN